MVTVIIPAWRAADTIRRAVRSVLAQTVPVHEILVIDDGSPDDVATPLDGLDRRIRVIRQANAGAGPARNRGIDEARGDWLAFLDADDEWYPDRLERQLDATNRWPEVGFLTSRFHLLHPGRETGRVAGPRRDMVDRPLQLTGATAFDFAAGTWTGTVLVRRSVVANHRFRHDLRTAEDREFWLRLLFATTSCAIGDPLAVQHVQEHSLSNSDVDNDCANMLKVVDLYREQIGAKAARRWRAAVLRRQAAGHLGEGRHRAARGPALERLRMEPAKLEAWWVAARSLLPDRTP